MCGWPEPYIFHVYLVVFKPKILYVHRILPIYKYILANPTYIQSPTYLRLTLAI